MTTIAAPAPLVTGGVDTHLDVHVAAALDSLGGVLGTASFPTTASGYRQLHRWLRTFGDVGKVGVEGTGSYGVELSRHLSSQGVQVIEVSRPNRQVRRRYGKTDVVDAIAAARAVQSGEASAIPKSHDGDVEALRALKVLQRSARKARTQALNQLRNLLVTAPDELRTKLRDLSTKELLETCVSFRVAADDDTLAGITRYALRDLAHRVIDLDQRQDAIRTRLHRIAVAVAPELLAIKGIGPDVAATLLLTAGDNPGRLRSERSFAALCGTNPVPASSGKTQRHRLNRGGDRQANAALWRVALVRLGSDQRSKDYMNKRISEGKSKKEAIRCLKRYIAREVFAALPREHLI
ncbi:MAG: IS110 family transposase [Streptomyces sp.]|nr:IS110 family transposase [Streptomyces sp.]